MCDEKNFIFEFIEILTRWCCANQKKNNYMTIKTWWPLALLNTIEKTLKTMINHKLFYLIKHHKWFFASKIKTKSNRSMKTALKFFIEQIHTIWNTKNHKIATLLNMIVVRVFSTINHERLLHNFWKKEIFEWIIKWTASFVKTKRMILSFA